MIIHAKLHFNSSECLICYCCHNKINTLYVSLYGYGEYGDRPCKIYKCAQCLIEFSSPNINLKLQSWELETVSDWYMSNVVCISDDAKREIDKLRVISKNFN